MSASRNAGSPHSKSGLRLRQGYGAQASGASPSQRQFWIFGTRGARPSEIFVPSLVGTHGLMRPVGKYFVGHPAKATEMRKQ
jgi:hypothetical protein